MCFAPVNPADLLAIDGRYAFTLDDTVPIGAEGVGIVDRIGDVVTDLNPSDRVLPLTRGNWCRYRTVPRADLLRLDVDIELGQAAMLRINPPTAWLLLEALGVVPGDCLVQNAASSAVAAWVRRIAATRQVRVIDVVRRPDPALPGAILDGEGLADRVRIAAAGRPVCAALDCVAGAATGRLAECLAPGGRLIVFGHLSGDPVSVRSQLLTGGGLTITGFSLRPTEAAMRETDRAAMFAAIFALHIASPAPLPVRALLPLSQVEDAVAFARTSGQGRVLLDLAG